MKIDTNNLSNDQENLINQYDEKQKIKGSFSKFLEMGAFSAAGVLLGSGMPTVALLLVQTALEKYGPAIPPTVAITTAIVGAAAGAIAGLIVGHNSHKEHNENVEKENAINVELSPENLVEKKIKTISNINLMREKSMENERAKKSGRSNAFINIMTL